MKIRKPKRKSAEEQTAARLKNPRRRRRCVESRSLDLEGAEKEPPGDRGACEQESTSQGSE